MRQAPIKSIATVTLCRHENQDFPDGLQRSCSHFYDRKIFNYERAAYHEQDKRPLSSGPVDRLDLILAPDVTFALLPRTSHRPRLPGATYFRNHAEKVGN